jgi:hypothetical protein
LILVSTFLQLENFNFKTALNGFSFVICIINLIFVTGILLYGFIKINFKFNYENFQNTKNIVENFYDDLNYDTDYFLKEKF